MKALAFSLFSTCSLVVLVALDKETSHLKTFQLQSDSDILYRGRLIGRYNIDSLKQEKADSQYQPRTPAEKKHDTVGNL